MALHYKSAEALGTAIARQCSHRLLSTTSRQLAPPTLSSTVEIHPAMTAGDGVRDFSEVPGPRSLPLLGNYLQIHGRLDDMHNVFTELREVYGDIYKFQLPSRSPMIVLSDLEAIEKLFRNEGVNPIRTQKNAYMWYLEHTQSSLGFLFSNGEEWRRVRSAVSKQTAPRCAINLAPQLSSVCSELISLIQKDRDSSNMPINDMKDYLSSWTFESISVILLNKGQGMLSENPSEMGIRFKEAGLAYLLNMMKFLYALPLYKIYPTKPYIEFDKSVKQLMSVTEEIMSEKVKEMSSALDAGREVEQIGFLDQWLMEGKLSKAELLPIFGDLLSAGIDTTANTAAFLLHEVAKNPEVQERIHKEVTDVAGANPPTAQDIAKLTFTKNCIKETLRLYPISHMFRGIPEDMVLCGYHIPKGITVVFPTYTLGRSEENFEDALTFKPDRWDKGARSHNPFAYIPWGFGPRSCYGRRLAELNLVLMLAQVVQNFKMSTPQESLKVIRKIVMQPGEPLELKFEDRIN